MPTTTNYGVVVPSSGTEPADMYGVATRLGNSVDAKFANIEGAWTTYTPTWTTSAGSPAIGNGTIVGKYMKAGKLTFFRILMTMGTTTSYGTAGSSWSLTVPYAPVTAVNGPAFNAIARDASASFSYLVIGELIPAGTLSMRVTGGASGVFASVTNTAPFTWATTDTLLVSGFYEAA